MAEHTESHVALAAQSGSCIVGTDQRGMRAAIAFVWLATGLGVLHPYYREVGHSYLAPLGLPDSVMVLTCVGEVLLAGWLLLRPLSTWLVAGQVTLILGFTFILAWLDPWLLVHPCGILTKNLPLLSLLGAAWLHQREGWSPRALRLLRGGVGIIWITEGLFPKVLFQQPDEVAIVADSGLTLGSPALFLAILGVAEALSGVAVLCLRGWPVRVILVGQLGALLVLPALVTLQQPLFWVHPFGPFTKNVPILAGTLLVLLRDRPSEA